MSTTIRIMLDKRDGTTVELGSIGSKDGEEIYSACASLIGDPEGRDTITLGLLTWIMKLQEFAQIQDQKKETE